MALDIDDKGKNNQLRIEDPDSIGILRIVLHGDDNRVIIGRGSKFNSGFIELGAECCFEAGASNNFSRMRVYGKTKARIAFGAGNGFTWESSILAHEPSSIVFGDGCLVASGCSIMSSDMHSIVDLATGRRINGARDILIGNRVWLGEHVRVLKGARIGEGSVIGAGSTVTATPIPRNVVAVGSPARVVREGISWRHDLIPET